MNFILQAFYWDCFKIEKKVGAWWKYLKGMVPEMKQFGINTLYLPPPFKGGDGIRSMGYDPYDYYDLGTYDQKNSVSTAYGTQTDLLDLIKTAHQNGIKVITDLVINHCSGADIKEVNPINGKKGWTGFNPASGKFVRNWECFYPSSFAKQKKGEVFDPFVNLCYENPYVRKEVLMLCKWLIEEMCFDGFRFDFAKGYPAEVVGEIMRTDYRRNEKPFKITGIAEVWDENPKVIDNWMKGTNLDVQYDLTLLDFIVQRLLSDMFEKKIFSIHRNMDRFKSIEKLKKVRSTGFLDNHDTFRNGKKKSLDFIFVSYAYLILHYPSVSMFWLHYLEISKKKEMVGAIRSLEDLTRGDNIEVLDTKPVKNKVLLSEIKIKENKLNGVAIFNFNSETTNLPINLKDHKSVLCLKEYWPTNETGFQYKIYPDSRNFVEIPLPSFGYVIYLEEITN